MDKISLDGEWRLYSQITAKVPGCVHTDLKAAGWSVIDYYLAPKAGYYSFKKCAAECILSIDKKQDGLYLYLCNETDRDITECVTVEEIDIESSEVIKSTSVTVNAGVRTSTYTKIDGVTAEPKTVVIAENNMLSRVFFKCDGCKIERVPAPEITKVDINSVTLKAVCYTHVVELCGKCDFEDNFFIMKKGEERNVKFIGSADDIKVNAYSFK